MYILFAEIVIAIIALCFSQIYFPIKGRKGILLGCVVEEEQKKNEFSKIIKSYKNYTLIGCIISIICVAFAFFIKATIFTVFIFLAYIIYSFILTAIYNIKTKNIKAKIKNLCVSKREVAIVHFEKAKISKASVFLYVFITLLTLGINSVAIYIYYPKIQHIDSLTNSFSTSMVVLVILLIAYIVFDILLTKFNYKIDPKNPEDSIKQLNKIKKDTSKLILFAIVPELITITCMNLKELKIININILMLIAIMQIILLFGVITFSIKISKKRNNYKEKYKDVTFKDDDSYWKLGMFYYNRENPSIFVEKRSGIGFTINAGSVGGMIFYAILIILILVPLTIPMLIQII